VISVSDNIKTYDGGWSIALQYPLQKADHPTRGTAPNGFKIDSVRDADGADKEVDAGRGSDGLRSDASGSRVAISFSSTVALDCLKLAARKLRF
jgi:hypothetical protein